LRSGYVDNSAGAQRGRWSECGRATPGADSEPVGRSLSQFHHWGGRIMTPATKRNMLIVNLSFILPWMIFSLCGFLAAEQGGIYQATRSWYVKGPGGRYGALESEATKEANHSWEHVAWETQFYCGPLRVSLPFPAPVAIRVLALWAATPVLVALLLRFGRYAVRHTKAA
jgi:hypothetical protein